MHQGMVAIGGEDIDTKIDLFYNLKDQNEKDCLHCNRIQKIERRWIIGMRSTSMTTSSTVLRSLDKIREYWNGMAYDILANELGEDIWDKWEEYSNLKRQDALACSTQI